MRDYLKEKGIKIEFFDDRVRFRNCSDGKECKFVKYAMNKDIDARPIDCKIYPYSVDWHTIDFKYNFVDKVIPLKYDKLSGWLWKKSDKYRNNKKEVICKPRRGDR